MKIFRTLFMLLAMLQSQTGTADVLVLVHGYLGSADSWERSGINSLLDQQGWKRTGLFTPGPTGPRLLTTGNVNADNNVYDVTLPSIAPIPVQADFLQNMLDQIRAVHPDENLIIAAHSAGGVVARLALVRAGAKHVKQLITIASPHLGTSRAEQALDVTADQGPLNVVKSFFGGNTYDTLKHSRPLLADLTYPRPGNLLNWLNLQPHPDIEYVSVIRANPAGVPGDDIVPGFSQDMNNVPVLRGRSLVMITPAPHELNARDAGVILSLLRQDS
jgi:pimeloyl-ACP methyl ester carboxylesterase